MTAVPVRPLRARPINKHRTEGLPLLMTDLSIVVPAYDEAASISRFLSELDAELSRAGFTDSEIIVVDDGSSDGTGDLASRVATAVPVRVLRQRNQGRFEARRVGIEAAAYDRTMLIDCGLTLRAGSMSFLREQTEAHPEREIWNGHVDIEVRGNPYAGFWSAIVRIFWGAYLRRPTLTSFGLDDFDRYPKGTGLFLAPTAALRAAVGAFALEGIESRYASDDTRLIRSLLSASPRIWISPEFGCSYGARSTFRQFASHSTFRGTTFVDGYWASPSLIGSALRTFAWLAPVLGVACAVGLVLAPAAMLTALAALLVVGVLVAFGLGLQSGSTLLVSTEFAVLLPVFAAAFGLGAARGLLLRPGRRGSRR